MAYYGALLIFQLHRNWNIKILLSGLLCTLWWLCVGSVVAAQWLIVFPCRFCGGSSVAHWRLYGCFAAAPRPFFSGTMMAPRWLCGGSKVACNLTAIFSRSLYGIFTVASRWILICSVQALPCHWDGFAVAPWRLRGSSVVASPWLCGAFWYVCISVYCFQPDPNKVVYFVT